MEMFLGIIGFELGICLGLPCVIIVLDSNVARDTREPQIVCESLGFPRCFSTCFARRGAVYLHLRIASRRNSRLDPQDM